MSSLAVSLGFALLLAGGEAGRGEQASRLTGRELEQWQNMAPAIATVLDSADKAIAAAALIDDSGLFVTAKNCVPASGDVRMRLSNGHLIHVNVIGRNGATGLALLEAEGWSNPEIHALKPPVEKEQKGARMFAVLANGPIRAEFVSDQWTGVRTKSRLTVPLSEIRFEAPAELIGSALIVCENGEFIGVLSATLQNRQDQSPSQGGGQQMFPTPNNGGFTGNRLQQNNIGPSSMTVAYTVGQDVVRQVLEGFRSPSHQVQFPSLGAFCNDSGGTGAAIQRISADSAAEHAGMKVGDVIQEINGIPIRDQITFGKVMMKQRVGARIMVKALRQNTMLIAFEVTVGKAVDRD